MHNHLGPAHLDANTRTRINAIAEGNPLFLEQMVAMVAQKGELGDDLEIPPTIQALLAARIEPLGPGERAILERAAIAGREFSSKAIAELLPVDARSTTARHLDTLVGKDFLRSEHASPEHAELFRFRHVLIQQSVYRSIPKRLRADLHEAFAAWLDLSAPEAKIEVEEVVGYHLEQAHRYRLEVGPVTARELDLGRRAGHRLASAGRRAFKAGDMPASVNLLGRATALLPSDDPIGLELLSDLAYALFEVGHLEQASDALAEVIEQGRNVEASRLVARAMVQRGHIEMYRHPEAVDAERLLREAAAAKLILHKAGDDVGLARAATLVSEVQWTLGSGARATQAAKEAARYSRRSGSRRDEAWSAGDYGYYAVFGPTTVAEGTRQMERWLTEASGDPVLEANLTGFLAPMAAMSGRIPEARERLAQSRLATERLGLRWQTGTHDLLASVVEMLADDPFAADAHLSKAIDMFAEMGDMWFVSILSIERARALCRQGRYDDALSLIEHLDTLPADPGPSYRIRRCEVLGRVLYQRADRAAALASLREAVERGEQTDFLGFHADALMALGEALRAEGQRDDAARAAGSAIQLYEQKGNVAEATKARSWLAGDP
jgi:tetratricopeptide (TPR) repeat protein